MEDETILNKYIQLLENRIELCSVFGGDASSSIHQTMSLVDLFPFESIPSGSELRH